MTTPAGDIALSALEWGLFELNNWVTDPCHEPEPEPAPAPYEPHQPPLPDGYNPNVGWEDTNGDGILDTYTPPGP